MNVKGKIVYHNGDKVRLTGKVIHLYGADWYVGVQVGGHRDGREVVIRKKD